MLRPAPAFPATAFRCAAFPLTRFSALPKIVRMRLLFSSSYQMLTLTGNPPERASASRAKGLYCIERLAALLEHPPNRKGKE